MVIASVILQLHGVYYLHKAYGGVMAFFYTDQEVFGFDIGRSSIKIVQIDQSSSKKQKGTIRAYGNTSFDPKAIKAGVVVEPEIIVKAAHDLIANGMIGKLNTKHVSLSLPNSHSFSRIVTLPKLDEESAEAAVKAEIAQSIPMPLAELYYDYLIIDSADEQNSEVQIVASPKKIVDSYIEVTSALGLTAAVIEPNINAVSRMVVQSESPDGVTLIVDLGSEASDLSIYDGSVVRVTGTVDCGSENITTKIAASLGVSNQQAHGIKARYGLNVSKKQKEIMQAAQPELDKLIREIKKVMRYYSERAEEDTQISQIIILGGGANLPGLSTYITDQTRIPTRLNALWSNLDFGKLQPPHELETTIYTTAGGLSLIPAKEIAS